MVQGPSPYPTSQETVAGNLNGRPAWTPSAPKKVEETSEDWTKGLPEESIRSFRNIDNTSPGATIQGKSRIATPKPTEEKQAVNAPIVYTRLQFMLSDEDRLRTSLGFLIDQNINALGELCRYVDAKPDFSAADERIVKILLERVPKNAFSRFPILLRKMELGLLGWENYEGTKKEGYEIKKFIAKGGMGAVYVAREHGVDRDVAVKIITDPDRDPYREARLLGKIQTKVPVVVPIFAGKKVGLYPILVMPLLKGVLDLNQILKMGFGGEKIGREARFVACLKMTESVEAMHNAGIIHRDIKPANFLVRGLRNASVDELLAEVELLGADFGVAREDTEEEKLRDKEYNVDGSEKIFGTPLYMPKEQAASEELDTSCDVYALAVSQYQVLTGSLPYPEKRVTSSIGIMSHKMMKEGPDIEENDPKLVALGIPPELRGMLSRATDQSDRSNRPSAVELKEEWEKYVHTFTAEFRDSEEKDVAIIQAKTSMSRRGFLALLGGGAAALAAGAIPFAYWEIQSANFMSGHRANLEKINARLKEGKRSEAMQLLNDEITRVEATTDISDEKKNEVLSTLRCKKAYMDGAWAYAKGKVDDARREFAMVNVSLLNPEERQNFQEMTRILATWEETLAGIQKEIIDICNIDDLAQFQAAIEPLKTRAAQGDEDALSTILEVKKYLKDHPPRIRRRGRDAIDATSITDAIELRSVPEWVHHQKKRRCVDNVILDDLYKEIVREIQNPGALYYLESDFKEFIDTKKLKLQDLLGEEKFEEYCSEFIKVLKYVHCLNVWTSRQDLLEIPPAPNTSAYLSTYLTEALMSASANLTKKYKLSLLAEIREKFKDDHNDDLIRQFSEHHLSVPESN